MERAYVPTAQGSSGLTGEGEVGGAVSIPTGPAGGGVGWTVSGLGDVPEAPDDGPAPGLGSWPALNKG